MPGWSDNSGKARADFERLANAKITRSIFFNTLLEPCESVRSRSGFRRESATSGHAALSAWMARPAMINDATLGGEHDTIVYGEGAEVAGHARGDVSPPTPPRQLRVSRRQYRQSPHGPTCCTQ